MRDEKTGVVFRHTVETLIHNVLRTHDLLTPDAQAQLRAIGVEPSNVRDMPFSTWTKLLSCCAAIGAPGKPEDEALVELGRRWIDGYMNTFMGKSTLMIARLLGPRKMLMKMADNWRTVNDFYVAKSTAVNDRHVDIELNVGGVVRHFNTGVIQRMFETIGITTCVVVTREVPAGTQFTVTWS
jgi:uncharacterized protein (TIGR02265 family)